MRLARLRLRSLRDAPIKIWGATAAFCGRADLGAKRRHLKRQCLPGVRRLRRRSPDSSSHGAGEAAALFAAEVGIERHGDVAHHQVPLRQQYDGVVGYLDQSIGDMFVQLG